MRSEVQTQGEGDGGRVRDRRIYTYIEAASVRISRIG